MPWPHAASIPGPRSRVCRGTYYPWPGHGCGEILAAPVDPRPASSPPGRSVFPGTCPWPTRSERHAAARGQRDSQARPNPDLKVVSRRLPVADNQRFCPKCGAQALPEASFCARCGGPLVPVIPPSPTMVPPSVRAMGERRYYSKHVDDDADSKNMRVVVRHWDSPGRVCATGTYFAARLGLNVVAPWWPRAVDRPAVASRNQSSACRRRASVKRAEVKATLIAAMTWPV